LFLSGKDYEGEKEMKSVKGTQTEKNLLAAFAGESQARNRYTYYASIAKKEGYEQISSLFLETADNEKEHAKRFFQLLEGGMVEITNTYPAGIITSTIDNLKAAATGEHEEWTHLYVAAAKTAKEEGFPEIALQFEHIALVEKEHEKRYLKLVNNIESGTIFSKVISIEWKCRNCGYHAIGNSAPVLCPGCAHPQSYFEAFSENY